jgi:hypothetical protein
MEFVEDNLVGGVGNVGKRRANVWLVHVHRDPFDA